MGRRRARTLRRTRAWVRVALWMAAFAAAAWLAYSLARSRPQDVPWTDLDFAQPIGMFTGRKLAALGEDSAQCRLLLDRAGIRTASVPPRGAAQCLFADGVRFTPGGARTTPWHPQAPPIACPVAAALALWEWHVVQPAARVHLKTGIAGIDHLGSYSCRRMYGRGDGRWSEHSTGDAIDIAAFRTRDGRRVSLIADWNGARGADGAARAAFLRAVRDGACDVFATVLSPDYNAAHRDHLHLDQARRGALGGSACR